MLIDDELPHIYLIPATEWKNENDLLKGRDYEGKKSEPEWGINISQKNMPILEKYLVDNFISSL